MDNHQAYGSLSAVIRELLGLSGTVDLRAEVRSSGHTLAGNAKLLTVLERIAEKNPPYTGCELYRLAAKQAEQTGWRNVMVNVLVVDADAKAKPSDHCSKSITPAVN